MKKNSTVGVLKVSRFSDKSRLPLKSFAGDLGYDLFSAEDVILGPGVSQAVSTGISVEFPPGWGGFIKDRSSIAARGVYTSAGVIDNGYRGELKIVIRNDSGEEFTVKAGDRVAQLVPVPVTDWQVVESGSQGLAGSDRNRRGFGSSGR